MGQQHRHIAFDAIFDLSGAVDAAVAAAVASYPGVDARGMSAADAPGVIDEPCPERRVVAWLRAAAGAPGPPAPEAAIHAPLVYRLYAEHLLGGGLYTAIHGEPRRYATGPALVDRAVLRPDAPALIAGATAGDVLVAWLPAPVALYLLVSAGLTGSAARVAAYPEAYDPASVAPTL